MILLGSNFGDICQTKGKDQFLKLTKAIIIMIIIIISKNLREETYRKQRGQLGSSRLNNMVLICGMDLNG